MKIHRSNLPEEKTAIIIGHLNDAFDKSAIEKVPTPFSPNHPTLLPNLISFDPQDAATYVKKKCDEGLAGTWHCVVGRNFGCSITHDTKYVLFLQMEQLHVLIFKSLE